MVGFLSLIVAQAVVAPVLARPGNAVVARLGDAVAADWRAIPADELLVMTLAGGRRVVIRLAPRYAPAHVANIRRLAAAYWWDGESIYRVHDNYVVQWGDASEEGVAGRDRGAAAGGI